MATIHYTDSAVANTVENNIENFAKAITDSYFQNQPKLITLSADPACYAQAYYHAYKEIIQTLEQEIKLTRQKENKEVFGAFK